jgi:hypothetical protein
VTNPAGIYTSLVATTLAVSPEERLEHNDRIVAMIL